MSEDTGGAREEDERRAPRFGGFRLSTRRRCLIGTDGHEVALPPRPLAVFAALAERRDAVAARDTLLAEVWGHAHVTDDALGKCIGEIRRAIGDEAHTVLRTVPKQGYMLVADPLPEEAVAPASDTAGVDPTDAADSVDSRAVPDMPVRHPTPGNSRRWLPIAALAVVLGGIWLVVSDDAERGTDGPRDNAVAYRAAEADETGPSRAAPSLALRLREGATDEARALRHAVRAALARYRTVRLADAAPTDLVLELTVLDSDGKRVAAELRAPASDTLLFAETFDLVGPEAEERFGVRLAAMVASPASGYLARHLIARSRDKSPDEVTAAECYAQGYDCTNCSGELDSIDRRAASCLARLVREDPNDARAWALQATLNAHRYQWGTGLAEPGYSDLDARAHLPALAIDAANRAEQLSDGGDSAVYWAMAQAYQTTCEIDKLATAVERGLAINPDDPSLLAVFGNWLAYAGEWDRGAALTERALEIEPRHFRPWWLFSIAKRHYARAEYEQALAWFRKAFNERNWLSHLQLAYTLPHLGRHEEARAALARAENLLPGITIEFAVQLYAVYCFPEDYIARMVTALESIGMPSRGDHTNLRDPEVPHARLLTIGDWTVEYMDLGEGVPVVFVHGAMSDYRTWAYYQNPVSAKYRYISYSRRYHGSQPWTDAGERSGPVNAGRDLADFLDALGLERVFLVGWSSSADPILHLALERPELVGGIVLYEPVNTSLADETDEGFPQAARDRFFARFGRVMEHVEAGREEAAVRAFLENVFEYPDGGFDRETMAVRRVILDNAAMVPLRLTRWRSTLVCDDLARVGAPTLIVGGEKTHAFWQYLTRKFARCIPDADFTVLAGVRHDGPLRKPPELFALIERFITRHRDVGTRTSSSPTAVEAR